MFTSYGARQICAGTILLLFGMVAGKNPLLASDNQQTQQQKMAMTIRSEMRSVLDTEFACWYPRSIDTVYGGFLSDFNYAWQAQGVQNKMIVTQARHVWSATNAAMFYQKDTAFRSIAAHGIRFLQTKMWDNEFGGFYDLVSREGNPILENNKIVKRAYGHAFVIYGLAAYFRASDDSAALQWAQRTYQWLENHSYDSLYGGYFQFLTREGKPYTEGTDGTLPKDYNSTIHLLEAYTQLYRVWNDPILRQRLESLLEIVRDKMCDPQGYLQLYFTKDWKHLSYRDSSESVRKRNYYFDHISFGHDVETAYLMLETSEALYGEYDSTTLCMAKKLVDHALENGWDKEYGGLFDGGYYPKGKTKIEIVKNTKEWWSQLEALNSFLLFANLFPNDEHHYFDKFIAQWEYCKKYLIDNKYGGFYWGGLDKEPSQRTAPKASIWKGNYHTSRALVNCIQTLRKMSLAYGDKGYEPVNPNATQEARELLQFLYSLKGKRIIAGHHNAATSPDQYPNRVKELTGKRPLIWGCDFIHYYMPGNPQTLVEEAFKKYKEGYIITLMWHAGRPMDDPPFGWKESIQAELTDDEWTELITPGTNLHNRWLAQIDTVAKYLKELRDLGVPVIWRPYHEINGVWFWWGDRKGERGSAQLYRMMFDRYVHYHHLDNLIWVWNTNAPRQRIDDEAFAYEDYFPGLEYVDVLGTDIYRKDYRQSHHDELVELGKGKIIALAEIGEVPDPKIFDEQPYWSWFMIWSNFVDYQNTPEEIRRLYHSPRVLTYEEYIQSKK